MLKNGFEEIRVSLLLIVLSAMDVLFCIGRKVSAELNRLEQKNQQR